MPTPQRRLRRLAAHLAPPHHPRPSAAAAAPADPPTLALAPRQLTPAALMLGGGLSSISAVSDSEATEIVHACLRCGIRDYDNAPLYVSIYSYPHAPRQWLC